MASLQEFYGFLEDYAGFYTRLAEEEKSKLEALLSNQLEAIEHAVARQQAASMQMEQFEKKRMDLQLELGMGTVAISGVIEQAAEEYRQPLQDLAVQLREAVEQVKFYNGKSMELVKTNLELINGELPPSERTHTGYTQKGKQDAGWGCGSSLIDAKI